MLIATFALPGEYTVQLAVNDEKTHWYVTYGLAPVVVKTSFSEAIKEFNACITHSASCASLLGDMDSFDEEE